MPTASTIFTFAVLRRLQLPLWVALSGLMLSACSLLSDAPWQKKKEQAQAAKPVPVGAAPVATHRFEFDPEKDDVVGTLQVTQVGPDDTLPDIARRFNVGYEEILRANPGVDPWLPGEGREIVLPTRFVLPNAPRQGVVINVPAMRLFYFPKVAKGKPAVVITHPIGIGKVGWATPEGATKIIKRTKDPVWTVPASVRKEHLENGDELPPTVPPGPDNPLGRHSFTLGWPSYLVHGTNKPYGVGMRSSHGCIRLYPEDIEQLFETVPIGTALRVVNQPFLFGRSGDDLVLQPYGVLEDDKRDWQKSHRKLLDKTISPAIRKMLKERGTQIDWARVEKLAAEPRGLPVPALVAKTQPEPSLESVLLAALKVQNVLPQGATWDGEVSVDEIKFEELMSDREPDENSEESSDDNKTNNSSGTH